MSNMISEEDIVITIILKDIIRDIDILSILNEYTTTSTFNRIIPTLTYAKPSHHLKELRKVPCRCYEYEQIQYLEW